MISEILDPDYKVVQSCGRVAGLLSKILADSIILPLNLQNFPHKMKEGLEKINKKGYAAKIKSFYPKYG